MAARLYRVHSTKDDGTEIVWLALRYLWNEPPVRYTEAIRGLSAPVEADVRAQEAVDELFTYGEARQWRDYLRKHYDDLSSEIVEEALPLEPDAKALHYTTGARLEAAVRNKDYPFSFDVYAVPG